MKKKANPSRRFIRIYFILYIISLIICLSYLFGGLLPLALQQKMPRNIDLYIGAVIQGLMVISIVLAIIFWKHDKKPMRTILTISIFQFACNVLIILLGITIADSFYYFIIGSFLAILGPHRLVSGTGGILSMGVLWGLVTIFAFCKRRRFRFSETREATE